MWRSEVDITIFLRHFSPYFFKAESLSIWTWSSLSQQTPGVYLSPPSMSLGLYTMPFCPLFPPSIFCIYLYVVNICMYVSVHVGGYMSWCLWESQRRTCWIYPLLPSHGLWGLTLGCQIWSSVPLLADLSLWHCDWPFYVSTGDLNSGTHVCTAGLRLHSTHFNQIAVPGLKPMSNNVRGVSTWWVYSDGCCHLVSGVFTSSACLISDL